MSAVRGHNEATDYLRIFTRPRHVYSYTASALQSMLANVIVLQELNDRMIVATDNEQEIEMAWLIGRTSRILLVVPPLEMIDDYDYNEDLDDFNRLRQTSIPTENLGDLWTHTQDVFSGFTEATLGSQGNSSET